MILNCSRSSTLFLPLILLGFLMCCPVAFATEPTPTETNSLIVAYQLLDDSWIQEVGALTNDFARIYKDSLSTNQPPSYGAWVADGNNLTFTSFSQRDLWDYMYNNNNSSNQNLFRSYVQTDDIGEYITVSRLMTASQGGSMTNNFNGSWSLNVKDLALQNNARRLVSLSTVQTEQEIAAISNAACNCDWQIVTNIFNCVYAISNTLDSVEYNTYHSMTNTEAILDALYSNWQGQEISLADWTRYIWVYLTTNNSGKPLKDLLVDLNNSIVSNSFYLASITNQLPNPLYYNTISNVLEQIGGYALRPNYQFPNWLDKLRPQWNNTPSSFSDYIDYYLNTEGISETISQFNEYFKWNSLGFQNYLDYISFSSGENAIFSYLNYLNSSFLASDFINLYNNITNKTEGIVYGVILPELNNVQNEPNIYSALTNAYLNSYNQQSDLTWLDRVELLLAALVFPDTSSTNTVEDADTAQSSSEQTARQFTDQLNQVSQALVSHSVQQDFTQVSGHLSTLLETLKQNLVFRKPEIISVSTLEEPLDVLGEQPTDAFNVDTTFGGLSGFIDFLRNLTSLLWVVLFFLLAYKAILVIFKAYYSVYNFSQAIFRKILG